MQSILKMKVKKCFSIKSRMLVAPVTSLCLVVHLGAFIGFTNTVHSQETGTIERWDAAYRKHQDVSPEYLEVEVESVDVRQAGGFFSTSGHRISATARVLKVYRTSTGLTPGSTIEIYYFRPSEAGTAPEHPEMLEEGTIYPAFLRARGKGYEPSAKHLSFIPLSEIQIEELTEAVVAKRMGIPTTDSLSNGSLTNPTVDPSMETNMAEGEQPNMDESGVRVPRNLRDPSMEPSVTGGASADVAATTGPTPNKPSLTAEKRMRLSDIQQDPTSMERPRTEKLSETNMEESTPEIATTDPARSKLSLVQTDPTTIDRLNEKKGQPVLTQSEEEARAEARQRALDAYRGKTETTPETPDMPEVAAPEPVNTPEPSESENTPNPNITLRPTPEAVDPDKISSSPPPASPEPIVNKEPAMVELIEETPVQPEPVKKTTPKPVEKPVVKAEPKQPKAPTMREPVREEKLTITDVPAPAAPTISSPKVDQETLDAYADIYILMKHGEQAVVKGDNDRAKKYYQRARTDLLKLQRDKPKFQPFMVEYRLRDVRRKLDALGEQ